MDDNYSNEKHDPDEQQGLAEEADEETAEFSRTDARVVEPGEDSQTGEDLEAAQMAERAREVCETIISHFPLSKPAKVSVSWDEEAIHLQITADGSGLLIGKKGQTLDAMQYIVNKITNRRTASKRRVEIDTEGYRQRRRGQLNNLARRAADEVRETGLQRVLEPMTPAERRIIHMALRDHPDVVTESEGSAPERRVVIKLRPPEEE